MNPSSPNEERVTLRDRFRAATREAILEAAAGLLTSEGGAHIRMEDIATKAGIAVGTLYNYFEDRTALATALLETRTRILIDALDGLASHPAPALPARAGVRAGSTPAEQFATELARFVAAVAQHVNTNRILMSLLIEDELHRGLDATALKARKSVRRDVFVRAEALMARGIRHKALRKGDAAVYAALLVGMIHGVVARALARGDRLPADGTAEIVRVFMSGTAR